MNHGVCFRYNAGGKWGLGHLFRCQLLADELLKKSIESIHIVNSDFDFSSPHKIVKLDEPGQIVHSKFAESEVLVLDLPFDIDQAEVKHLQKSHGKVVLLDQHGPQIKYSALTVNAIGHPENDIYPDSARLKQGSRYIILDSQLLVKKKQIADRVEKVLISMGGSDPHNITGRTLDLLPAVYPDCQFSLLLGPGFSEAARLKEKSEAMNNVECVEGGSARKVAEQLLKADCGILAFGLTVYAAAFAGLPALVLAHNSDGAAASHSFCQEARSFIDLGDHQAVTDENIIAAFDTILTDQRLRKSLSVNGERSVDGKGLGRVVDLLTVMI